MTIAMRIHPSEETVDQYVSGRLSGEELDRLEEHLLVCEECRGRVESAGAYVRAIKQALRELPAEQEEPKYRGHSQRWAMAFAGAAAAAFMLAIAVPQFRQQPVPEVTLVATRGGTEGAAVDGSRGVVLRLDVGGLPAVAQVAVLQPDGTPVWAGDGRRVGDMLVVEIPLSLQGSLLVRTLDAQGELTREFTFTAR